MNRKGFTLFELVLALAIIGILLGPVVNLVINTRKQSISHKTKIDGYILAVSKMEELKGVPFNLLTDFENDIFTESMIYKDKFQFEKNPDYAAFEKMYDYVFKRKYKPLQNYYRKYKRRVEIIDFKSKENKEENIKKVIVKVFLEKNDKIRLIAEMITYRNGL